MIHTIGSAVQIIGKDITGVKTYDGTIYVPLKALCAYLGIDHDWQRFKVRDNEELRAELVTLPGADGITRKTLCLPWETIGDWVATINPKTLKPEIVEALTDLLEDRDEGREGNNKVAAADPGISETAPEENKKKEAYNCFGNLNWFLDAFLLWAREMTDNDGDYFPGEEIVKASPEEIREYVRKVRCDIRLLQAIIDASTHYENMDNPVDESGLVELYNEAVKLYRSTNKFVEPFDENGNSCRKSGASYMDYLCGPGLDLMAQLGVELFADFQQKIIPPKEEGWRERELLKTVADGLFKRMGANTKKENGRQALELSTIQKPVDFLGRQINYVLDSDGNPYVPFKWLCEILGINHNEKRMEAKSCVGFNSKMLSFKDEDGRRRRMFCLPLEQIYFWIYRVDPNTVRPEIKERLVAYQEESSPALRHIRQYGLDFDPQSPAEEIESRVRVHFEKFIQERVPTGLNTMDREFAVFDSELRMFRKFENEPPPYRERALECIELATERWHKWLLTPPNQR